MPPKSPKIAELAAVRPKIEKPKAPPELTTSQKTIWDRVVSSTNASTTPDQQDLLVAYCRNADYSNQLSRQLDELLKKSPPVLSEEYSEYIKTVEKLSKVYSGVTAMLSSLSVKLRIANSAWRDTTVKQEIDNEPNVWDFK